MSNPYSASSFYNQYKQQNPLPAASSSSYAAGSGYYQGYGASSSATPVPANAYEYDVGMLEQQSVYVPGAATDRRGGAGGKVAKGGKRKTVLRNDGKATYEDQTLLDWDTSWFRLFVGDLSGEVSDDMLFKAFEKYNVKKVRVIRDRLSAKPRFGFVAFEDPEQFLKAWKEMDGKYVGNRPITLKKADNNIRPVEIGHKKAKQLEKDLKKKQKRHNPY